MNLSHSLSSLLPLDPELADRLGRAATSGIRPVPETAVALFVETILWAFSQELHFGEAVADGGITLAAEAPGALERYAVQVRRFGSRGAAQGRMVAIHLVGVLKTGRPDLERRFLETLDVLLAKGTYLLATPLEGLAHLLALPDPQSGLAYLGLLKAAFSAPLSYNRCTDLALRLSRAVRNMAESRRLDQIRALTRLAAGDTAMVDAFLEGAGKGLSLLDGKGLDRFVEMAMTQAGGGRESAGRFLSLSSGVGKAACEALQTAVPLDEVRGRLDRYLRARIGRSVAVRPLSALGRGDVTGPCTDGVTVFLPDELRRMPLRSENAHLYGCLTRIESGTIEFGTYDFDLQRALEACREAGIHLSCPPTDGKPELEAFFEGFPWPGLAADLFTVFESGRIRIGFERRYPGLARTAYEPIAAEAYRLQPAPAVSAAVLHGLYRTVGLGMPPDRPGREPATQAVIDRAARQFDSRTDGEAAVEVSAVLTAESYPDADACCRRAGEAEPTRLSLPFGRQLRPDLHFHVHREAYRLVDRLREQLRARGLDLHRTALVRRMGPSGRLTAEDVRAELEPEIGGTPTVADDDPDLARWIEAPAAPAAADEGHPAMWFKEWDHRIGDYLLRHVRVCDRRPSSGDGAFYEEVLSRRRQLVDRLRRAFELLRPEGVKRLRRWVDGDALDHREVVDSLLDRRVGRMPSDRLYTKRVKQRRDVSVLLLVDLSRSTSNVVEREGRTVLDVAKEAMVLFAEALEILGDRYAMAGFSGSGRLGVDYFRVKDFDHPLDHAVRATMGALTPQRSTRMGAAIRRAHQELDLAESRVRLLVVLSDGFPNDLDYKQAYAASDTRKAIAEGRSRGIFTHGITVNLPGHSRLDDLYGPNGHTVISDVLDLPDGLLRIYGALTRC